MYGKNGLKSKGQNKKQIVQSRTESSINHNKNTYYKNLRAPATLRGYKKRIIKKMAKKTDAEKVSEYMHLLDHPLKEEIDAVRDIIKNAHPGITERIKWNAPSYYTSADLVTFNPRMTQKVHLVFHHAAIVTIASALLEGDYQDRRMMYFKDMEAVLTQKNELDRILKELVSAVES
jgi:hypothetical protein